MKEIMLRWSIAAHQAPRTLAARSRANRDRFDPQAGEIMSQLVVIVGLVLAAAAAVLLLGPWIAGKVAQITAH